MSNYLIVVANQHRSKEIQIWAESLLAGQHEHELIELRPGVNLHYFARDAHADVQVRQRLLFKGFSIDHAQKTIAFGADGMRRLSSEMPCLVPSSQRIEGCHISAAWSDTEVSVKNDLFGLCSLLYTAENDFVAMSDSAYLLTALRKRLGYANVMNREVAIARSWGNSMGGQLLSQDTIVDAIKYAPVGTSLLVNIEHLIELIVMREPAEQVFKLRADTYAESMRLAGQRMASLIHTLSAVSVNSVRLSLSGGMDSRVLLAAALLSPIARENATFNCTNTNPSHAADYAVVADMSQSLGFPLGLRPSDEQTPSPTTRRVNESLGLWNLANAGVYDFLVFPNYVLNSVGAFGVTGHGAELHKGNYGWRPVQAIAANIRDATVSEAFLSQTEQALSSMGVDHDSPIGSEWHYLAYRNALHAGQASTTSMMGIRPLMMRDLVALNRSDVNCYPSPRKGKPSMVNDLLIMLSPSAAAFRFDDPSKNMSKDYVEVRSKALGGSLTADEIETYRIFGDFKDVRHGFPNVFKAIVDESGSWLRPSRQAIAEAVVDGYDKIDDPTVRDTYRPILKGAIEHLLDENIAYQQMRASAGKLMSFNILS